MKRHVALQRLLGALLSATLAISSVPISASALSSQGARDGGVEFGTSGQEAGDSHGDGDASQPSDGSAVAGLPLDAMEGVQPSGEADGSVVEGRDGTDLAEGLSDDDEQGMPADEDGQAEPGDAASEEMGPDTSDGGDGEPADGLPSSAEGEGGSPEDGGAPAGTDVEEAAESGTGSPEQDRGGLEAQATSTETTVTYLPAKPIELFLGSGEWDDYDKCYLYQYNPVAGDRIRVTVGDTTRTYTYTEDTYTWIDKNGASAWMSVQLYVRLTKAQNKLGSHKLYVDYFKDDSFVARGTVTFKIVESPIASMRYTPASTIYLVRGTDSSAIYEYDPASKTGGTYQKYFFPSDSRLVGDSLSISFEDGLSKTYVYKSFRHPTGGYEMLGFINRDDPSDIIEPYEIDLSSDQTYANRWGAGRHAFTLSYHGASASVAVRVTSPTVTKVRYVSKAAIRRSTASAITYTKNMNVYDDDYAEQAVHYQIVFKAPKPAEGDVIKVTEGDETLFYVYRATEKRFVCKTDASRTIALRDVIFRPFTAELGVTATAFSCQYRGVEFEVPFTIVRSPQIVKASGKQVFVGRKRQIGATTTGFAGTRITYKSSNTSVATVSSAGVITGKKVGTATITIQAKGNLAFKSQTKTIKVRVGTKRNPMRVTAKEAVTVKDGGSARVVAVSKAVGTVRFANVSTGYTAKKLKVDATTGRLTVPKGTKKGTFTLKIQVRANGKGAYFAKTKTVRVKVTVP